MVTNMDDQSKKDLLFLACLRNTRMCPLRGNALSVFIATCRDKKRTGRQLRKI